MQIELRKVRIQDIFNGYTDNDENGVTAYGGILDVRPPYQREFIYDDKQREAVINTVFNGYPLNVMYWGRNGDGYEIIDGQQRTMSICQYVNGDFSYGLRYFHNLTDDEKERMLDYELQIYICDGTTSEKLRWFETINIAGAELTKQELRNAVFSGTWLTDAKKYFSKNNCPAYRLAKDYIQGSTIRQDYLETALRWASKGDINDYMGKHADDGSAIALWNYFSNVINWVRALFLTYRKEMRGVEWGPLYDKYHERDINPMEMEKEVGRLMADSDVQKKKGIYEYVFDGDVRHLQIRLFDGNTKREVYERQGGICPICGEHFAIEEMEGDHIVPWSKGGHTSIDNCQMLCVKCNREKSGK